MSKHTHLVTRTLNTTRLPLSCLTAYILSLSPVYGQITSEPLSVNSFGDFRLRYHTINQDGLSQSSEALSLRTKAGIELNIFQNSTALIEFEGSKNFVENFNDTLNGQVNRPIIPDPENFGINRLQFQTELIPDTRLTLGRQTIALDDWRFIGHWHFRQNEQTFDAARVETKVGQGLLNLAYVTGVQRQFGNDSPMGEFDSNSIVLNYSLPTPVGRFVAFYYGLDLETGPENNRNSNASSATTGIRLNGRHKWLDWGLSWDGSIARQTDHADNTNDFAAIYASAKLGVEYRNYDIALKTELLGSDNGTAVQTPLGTLHRLNGFADKFLRTPNDGLQDISISTGYKLRNIGVFKDVRIGASYHWFESDEFSRNFGQEIDLGISAKWKNIRFDLEYANYDAEQFSTDTKAIILSTEYNFD